MFRKTLLVLFAMTMVGSTGNTDEAFAADRNVPRYTARHGLPAGLPRAHYSYRTTIIAGPPVPYDARPYAYGRYGYAPYINSYGIPAAVVVDPVDPAYLWRQPYPYGTPYYATPYSCFYYGDC
ncbi:hypothetical protein [Bradyrhizobium sp.]|uniref:hypothetical protein n=1 Tax=Bradyrhizobium sp. TaxID=376 RepID=UPI002E1834D1